MAEAGAVHVKVIVCEGTGGRYVVGDAAEAHIIVGAVKEVDILSRMVRHKFWWVLVVALVFAAGVVTGMISGLSCWVGRTMVVQQRGGTWVGEMVAW